MRKLLVVDLCGTIVKCNTTHGFMRYAALPFPRRLAAALILSRPGGFLLNRVHSGLQRKCLVACLWAAAKNDLAELGRDYARITLASNPREEVLQRIATARQQGVHVVLASASLDFIVSGFADVLEVEVAVSTQLGFSYRQRCRGVIAVDSTGRKLQLLREFVGGDFEFDVITDNPEDSDLMAVANNVWFIDAPE